MNPKKKLRKLNRKFQQKHFFWFSKRIDLEELQRSKEKIVELTSKIKDFEVSFQNKKPIKTI
jgi:hypothetical protein